MTLGISLSLLASALFGVLYYFSVMLNPMSGNDIFAWRMILTTPFMLVFVLAIGEQKLVLKIFKEIFLNPTIALFLVLSSALLSIQLWLFLWAPTAGRALEVSLGYFMLPLTLVISGRIFFHEKLTRLQLIAVTAASIGVIHELYRANGFSIPALTVALGYPIYFVLRKKFKTDHLGAFGLI